jgi:flagellar biogenesis protein FliO
MEIMLGILGVLAFIAGCLWMFRQLMKSGYQEFKPEDSE